MEQWDLVVYPVFFRKWKVKNRFRHLSKSVLCLKEAMPKLQIPLLHDPRPVWILQTEKISTMHTSF